MTKQELLQKLTDIEWDDFEVKEATTELPKSVWETVSSFCNTVGGWLVLGVKQNARNFEIVGIENGEKIEQDFWAVIRGRQKFNVVIDIDAKKIQNRQQIGIGVLYSCL